MARSPRLRQTVLRPRRTPSRRARGRLLTALTGLLLVSAGSPVLGTAAAGTYDVWSCKTPSGTPTSTAGWTSSSSLLYDQPGDDCALGGRLTAKFTATGGAVSGGLAARWAFRAPAGTTIASATLDRTAVARPHTADRSAVGAATLYRGAFRDDAEHRLQDCTSAEGVCAERERATVKVDAGMLGISAGCEGTAGSSLCAAGDGSRASFAIDSAKLTLRDDTAPVATVSGEALGTAPVRGASSVRLKASDVGAGVWQAEVRLGAAVVMERRTVSTNRGRCKTLPGTDAFGWPTPCRREVEATLPFGTKAAKDGSQLLTVTVWDAANNATVAVSRPVQVDNAKRVQDDGTILMPAIADPLDDAFVGGDSAAASTGALRPPTTGSEPQLARIVEAMNTLADAQIAYCYGGGHGTTPAVPSTGSYCWQGNPARKVTDTGATGFDCSSSVSWVLQVAGYDLPTITSTGFMTAGDAGEGQHLTIWTNPSHVYLEVKLDGRSYFWGTASSNPEHGPGWHPARSSEPFTARHLPGL